MNLLKEYVAQKEDLGTVSSIPVLIDAAKAYVTLGEMVAALKEVWGIHSEPPAF